MTVAYLETENGLVVRVAVERDDAGDERIRVEGLNCDLDGQAPGVYYPRPLEYEFPPDHHD
jgi:hypothetical protein